VARDHHGRADEASGGLAGRRERLGQDFVENVRGFLSQLALSAAAAVRAP